MKWVSMPFGLIRHIQKCEFLANFGLIKPQHFDSGY